MIFPLPVVVTENLNYNEAKSGKMEVTIQSMTGTVLQVTVKAQELFLHCHLKHIKEQQCKPNMWPEMYEINSQSCRFKWLSSRLQYSSCAEDSFASALFRPVSPSFVSPSPSQPPSLTVSQPQQIFEVFLVLTVVGSTSDL